MKRFIPIGFVLIGCQGNGTILVIDTDPPTILEGQTGETGPVYGTGPPTGICGDVTYYDLNVFGVAEYANGSPARNVDIDLEVLSIPPFEIVYIRAVRIQPNPNPNPRPPKGK